MRKRIFETILLILIPAGWFIAGLACLNYAYTLTFIVFQVGCTLLSIVFIFMSVIGSYAAVQEFYRKYEEKKHNKLT